MRKRADGGHDVRNQTGERGDVILAVAQNVFTFLPRKRWALDDAIPHLFLVGSVDRIDAEVPQRPVETVKPFRAISGLDAGVVGKVAEFDIRIEAARRLPPTQRKVSAELGAQHIPDNKGVSVQWVGRERTEIALPLTDNLVRSHFPGNQAKRRTRVALPAAIRETRAGIEFAIHDPDRAERQLAPIRYR